MLVQEYLSALRVERAYVAQQFPDDAGRLAEIDAEIEKFAPSVEKRKREAEDRAARRGPRGADDRPSAD